MNLPGAPPLATRVACRRITQHADASGGTIRVALLDEGGCRVRGHSADVHLAIAGNSLRHPVEWKHRRLDQLPTGRSMLRLQLHRAEVFA